MRLKRLIDTSTIQAYQILSPTKLIKKLFPKKFTYSFRLRERGTCGSSSTLPFIACMSETVGYIFTYGSTVPKIGLKLPTDPISTYPVCLDQYFVSDKADDKKIDIVLACKANQNIMPLGFTDEVIIRGNSLTMFGIDKKSSLENSSTASQCFEKSVLRVVNEHIHTYKTLEEWMFKVVMACPTDKNGMVIKYPSAISANTLKPRKITKKDIFVGYDYRPSGITDNPSEKNYAYENTLIQHIEDAFQDGNTDIVVNNNYNNIVPRMTKYMKAHKIPFKTVTEGACIIIKYKNLRKISIEFDLLDFL